MIVVADTGPLNYLVRLGFEDFLHELYGKIILPQGVLDESGHGATPAIVRAWALTLPAWVTSMEAKRLDASLPAGLGIGERHAISIALD